MTKPTVAKSRCNQQHAPIQLTFLFVEPSDAAAVVVGLEEQLSEELPQVDGLVGVVTHHI